MKNKKIYFLLSVLVLSCLVLFLGGQTFATDAEGGQVSVPGKITFESEEEDKVEEKTKEEIKKDNKLTADTTGKKFYSALPKTGETSSMSALIGLSMIVLTVGIYYQKRVGDQK